MIVKIKRRENPFAQIDKGILQDERLSYKARGIAAFLFSHSDGYEVRLNDLVNKSPDGIKAIRAGMQELKKAGYARLVPLFDENKNLKGKTWELNETADIPILATSPKSERREMGTTTNIVLSMDNTIIVELIEYLNEKAKRSFSPKTKATRQHLAARLKEGYTPEQIKSVIDDRVDRWANDAHMAEYLRPNTLFAGKFESYLQAAQAGPQHANTDDALNDIELGEAEAAAYQNYIKYTLNNYLNLFKSQCRIFSKSEYIDYLTNKTIPNVRFLLTASEKKSLQIKLHSRLNSDKYFRDKYPSVFEAYRAAVRAIANHEKPLV